ncbi:Uncharacterised protein [Escherichia coli]|uniref:Stability determinant domain-containing protein n=1 Tax=Escherichia coli TaxID=562 RepID=A0A3S5DV60_ECOLX|nr:Uncharacterised protein [Escherichia coli]
MSTALSPIILNLKQSNKKTAIRMVANKVAASLSDPRPAIPHDEVMAEMENLIAQLAATNRSE